MNVLWGEIENVKLYITMLFMLVNPFLDQPCKKGL